MSAAASISATGCAQGRPRCRCATRSRCSPSNSMAARTRDVATMAATGVSPDNDAMIERPLSPLDRLLVEVGRALETVNVPKPAAAQPSPAGDLADPALDERA